MESKVILPLSSYVTGVLHTVRISTAEFIMSSDTWIECPPGVREVMGSIPVGDSDFSLSHARVMLYTSSFTFNYRAQNSPSSFTYQLQSLWGIFPEPRAEVYWFRLNLNISKLELLYITFMCSSWL